MTIATPRQQSIERLDGLLRQGGSPIPSELREAFNDYLRVHHLWLLRLITWVSTLSYFSYGVADWILIPDVGTESLLMRAVFLALVLPTLLTLYSRMRSVALLDLLLPLAVLIANILWSLLLARSGSPNVQAYQYAGIIFTFIACMATQANFRAALPLLLANAAVTLGAAYWLFGRSLAMLGVFATAYLPMLAYGIGGAWLLTLQRRRAFLRNHLDRLRSQELSSLLEREQLTRQQYERFGSLISHEFRNALGVINSQVMTLRKEAEHGIAQLDKRTTSITGATRRLSSMFDTWLAGDRFQHSLQQARPQRLRLKPWLRQWLVVHADITVQHLVELHDDAFEIEADPELLQLALANLVGNACKYSAPGSRVRIETRSAPGWIGITVIDQGIGIAPEHQTRVLQAYFRVAPEGSVRGIGLGLSIVEQVARLHGGRIELRSTLGMGSEFCLWLPRAHGSPEPI